MRTTCLAILIVGGALSSQAQDPSQGIAPYQTYQTSNIDSINMFYGTLTLHIPLLSYPQVGSLPPVGVEITGNSNSWVESCFPADTPYYQPGNCYWAPGQWPAYPAAIQTTPALYYFPLENTGIPAFDAYFDTFIDQTGASHDLNLAADGTIVTVDATGFAFNGTVVKDKNGVSYSPVGPVYSNSNLRVTDPNGNQISYSYTPSNSSPSLTDSVGRTMPFVNPTFDFEGANTNVEAIGCTPYNYPGVGGTNYTLTFCYQGYTIKTNMVSDYINIWQTPNPDYNNNDYYGGWNLLSKVLLPNGASWSFDYNTYGDVSKITLPTGADISYTWAFSDGSLLPSLNPNRIVTSRTINLEDGSPPQLWTYDFVNHIQHDPGGNATVYTFGINSDPCDAHETSRRYYQGDYVAGKQPLKTIATSYSYTTLQAPGPDDDGCGQYINVVPSTITTTLDNGAVSSQTSVYDSGGRLYPSPDGPPYTYGLKTRESVTDFGQGSPGPLLQQTVTHYKWESTSSYLATHMLSAVASVCTPLVTSAECTPSANDTASYTSYGYDNQGLGNQTSVSKWQGGGTSLTWQKQYNAQGMVTTSIDPANNQTVVTYQCSGAFPHTATNALNQVTTYGYDCNTGLVTQIQDPNDAAAGRAGTTFGYTSMNDVQSVSYPNGKTITADYHGYQVPLTVTTTTTASPDPSVVQATVYDGLGRETHNQLTSDPAGTVFEDTQYDWAGRVSSVSNPYRTVPDGTEGATGTTYDAIGRPRLVTEPDSNTQQWNYQGATTTFTDEASNSWQRTQDGLGRLVSVREPNNALTNYTYDPSGNLLCVDQWGLGAVGNPCASPLLRRFSYDSLSRLTSAHNPETGTKTYQYVNASGGLCSGDPSLPCGTLDANGAPVTFWYDGLNRISARAGSFYDQFVYDTNPEGIGRLWAAGRLGMAGNAFYYDAGGNVTGTLWYDVTVGSWKSGPGAQYDQLGKPTQLSYPNGTVLSQVWDGAGRLQSVTDATSGGQGTIYFAGIAGTEQYWPNGTLQNATLGADVTESFWINNRQQPCRMGANSSAVSLIPGVGNLINREIRYSSAENICTNAPSNSGNVAQIIDETGGQQNFMYDHLNRLTSAFTSNRPASSSYNFTYNYNNNNDGGAFGNMVPIDNIHPNPAYSIEASTNRLKNGADITYNPDGTLATANGHIFYYSTEGQVVFVDGTATGYYYYDPLGQRSYANHSTSTWYNTVYLNSQSVADIDSGGNWTNYVYANGQKIARLTGSPIAPQVSYYLSDHLGTAQMEVSSSGVPTWSGWFTPFGQEVISGWAPNYLGPQPADGTAMRYKFTGKERDNESGLDYFGARYYGSTMGRFMSPDPGWYLQADVRNPQSWNQYSYVLNNPLINTDPDGRECVWDDGSYDSADDKQTGNAEGCSGQGGTYVPPANFENSLLTNGQMSNVQRGDWSPDANSTIAQSWVNNTPDVSATPMQNGTFTSNMNMSDFISMMQQSNFYRSDMDQALADRHWSAHSGIQMRQDTQGCNLHVNIDRNSGSNGQPVKGDFHYDTFNPNPNSQPADSLITAPLHTAEAIVDIGLTKAGVSGTVGDRACPSR